MTNFLIEEFKFYKVFLYSNKSEDSADCSIHIKLKSGMANLKFYEGNVPDNFVVNKGSFHDFHVNISLTKYPYFIDILRNEKPLFFYYDYNDNESYITTSEEPVGEEEHTQEEAYNIN